MHRNHAIHASLFGQTASQLCGMQVFSSACILFAFVITCLQLYSYQSATISDNIDASMLSMHARLHDDQGKSIVTKLSLEWVLDIPCMTMMQSMLLLPTGHQMEKRWVIMLSSDCPLPCTCGHGAAQSTHIHEQKKQNQSSRNCGFHGCCCLALQPRCIACVRSMVIAAAGRSVGCLLVVACMSELRFNSRVLLPPGEALCYSYWLELAHVMKHSSRMFVVKLWGGGVSWWCSGCMFFRREQITLFCSSLLCTPTVILLLSHGRS